MKEVFKDIVIGSSAVEIRRGEGGVVSIYADDVLGVQKGLGYAHAANRLMQLFLTRTLAQGKLTEYLFDTEEAFGFDLLIRKLGFAQDVKNDISNLSEAARSWCQAYCEGVNTYLDRFGPPTLCKIFKLKFSPWKIEDILLLIKMHTYLGLAQQQERIERMIIQTIHEGVNLECMKSLFHPHLDALEGGWLEALKHVRLCSPYLDIDMHFEPGLSNNWAVGPQKSASGKPLCAFDPHLQINRLPAIWYEAVLHTPTDVHMGITTPGVPGVVMGRSSSLCASFTYGMMDTIDFFIEEIDGEHYRREEGWKPLVIREELFLRKKEGKTALHFAETDIGVVERDSAVGKNLFLSLAWSGAEKGASPILNGLCQLWSLDSVFEAGKVVRELILPANWILADHKGNIAYQQSGRLPKRHLTTLFPLPAWEKQNLWEGFVDSEQLSCSYNPDCGFVASANDDKNERGKPLSITVPFAAYRHERICSVLSAEKTFSVEEMKHLQCDLYSLQAEAFMKEIREWIPQTPTGAILKTWDCRYNKESQGATLFEAFYHDLLLDVCGKVFGEKAWKRICNRHSLLVFTHGNFDRLLLSGDRAWFKTEEKQARFKRVLHTTLSRFAKRLVPSWGKENRFVMHNLLFSGKLPKFLGFDLGPLEIDGNRATVAACHIFRERKRELAAGASYRFVSDLNTDEAFTILAGGVSEDRFSKYYLSDVEKWLRFGYKKLNAEEKVFGAKNIGVDLGLKGF